MYKALFFTALTLFLMAPLFDVVNYLSGFDPGYFVKYFSLIFLLFGALNVSRGRIEKELIFPLLLFCYAIMSFILKTELIDIGYVALSHLFYGISPFLAMAFGVYLAARHQENVERGVQKIAKVFVLGLLALAVIYFCTDSLFLINPPSYSSGLVFAYVLSTQNIHVRGAKFWLLFFVDAFTGKRSSLVLWLFLIVKELRIYALFPLVFIAVITFCLSVYDLLPLRILAIFNPSHYTTEYGLSLISGGRSDEVFSVLDFLESNHYSMLGAGFGKAYLLISPITGWQEYRHYLHVTPITYFYVYGVFGALFYLNVVFTTFKLLRVKSCLLNFHLLVMVLSLSGATMLSNPLIWVVFGYLSSSKMKTI